MIFYVGLDDVHHANRFERCFISVNRLVRRKADFAVKDWIMDSGAFTEITTHGRYRTEPEIYAGLVNRWAACGNLEAAVSQDWMCEPWVLERTGLSVQDHQRLTIQRYDQIAALAKTYVMPVLQGFSPDDYVGHLQAYGKRLVTAMWVGVGSVCKRQSHPALIAYLLKGIKAERPDLRLHGFGIKVTAIKRQDVRDCLFSSDSMAWSFNARKNGRNAHDPAEAQRFVDRINGLHITEPKTLCLT